MRGEDCFLHGQLDGHNRGGATFPGCTKERRHMWRVQGGGTTDRGWPIPPGGGIRMPRAGARIGTGHRFSTVDGFAHGFNPRPDFVDQTDQRMETIWRLLGSQ